MVKPIKKKDDLVEDDVIRRFVTFHVERVLKETEAKIPTKDKVAIVEMIINYQGLALAELVVGTAEMLLDSTEDAEDGDTDEDEEEEGEE